MKNLFFMFLILFGLITNSYAVSYELSAGGQNTGIGTASPQDTLGVGGNLSVGDATYTQVAAPANGAIIQGNVGVGSINPGQKVDVTGSVRASGNFIGNLTGNAATVTTNANLTGDVTSVGNATTLPTVNSNVGTFQGLTVNGKGQVTAAGNQGYITNIGIGTANDIAYWNGTNTIAASNGLVLVSGNVGVGTTLPNRTLTVAMSSSNTNPTSASTASIGIDNLSGTAGTIAEFAMDTKDSTGNMVVGAKMATQFTSTTHSAVSGDLLIINKNAGTSQQNMMVRADGNVGIGTNAPTLATLTTEGNNYATDYKDPNLIGGRTYTYGICDDPTGAGCLVWMGADRNVGIGSRYPGFALDIQGTTRTTGFDLPGNGVASGNLLVTNNVGLGTWMPASTLLFSAALTPWISNINAAGFNLLSVGNIGIGTGLANNSLIINSGNVGVGTVTPGGALDVGAGAICLGHVCNTAWPTGSSQWNGTVGSPISYPQNVGVGTTLTTNGLDVATNGVSIGTGFAGYQSAGAGGLIVQGNVGIGTFKNTTSALTVFGGNVGIGTWIPTQPLTVGLASALTVSSAGSIATSSTAPLTMSGSNPKIIGSAGGGSILTIQGSGSATGGLTLQSTTATGTTDVINFKVGTNGGTTAATIIDSGNVGIGTTTPAGPFVVYKSASSIGWTVQAAGNTACNTTCTNHGGCVVGLDTGTAGVLNSAFVACTDATADDCLCAGP